MKPAAFAALLLTPAFAQAQTLSIHDEIQSFETLSGTTVQMTGRSELHITGRGTDPLPGSQIHLNSPDAWLFLRYVRPSTANSTFLGRVRVNGSTAVHGQNVRVVQHGVGTVVIPHAPDYPVLEVFRGPNFLDGPLTFRSNEMVQGLPAGRTPWNNAISSFRLKRGYMVAFAENANGGGFSRVYVAQDGDLEVGLLPDDLNNRIEFIRVIPWRWVSKKGYAGGGSDTGAVRSSWFYTWSADHNSSLDIEYVPTQQTSVWPGLSESRNKANVTHYLGYNEPNNPVEDAHKYTPTPQSTINHWPNLMRAGLRLGSPAPTDGGIGWLEQFMNLADAANLRVDYTVVHFYRGGQTTTQFYDFLRDAYLRNGRRPLWLKEWNNGANWTCCLPTFEQNAQVIKNWIDLMDGIPWVERYSIYSRVQEERQIRYGPSHDGPLTPMGVAYRDHESPIGYRQQLPAGLGNAAHYEFAGNVRDSLEDANHAMRIGAPKFAPAPAGTAMVFDGQNDWVQLPPNVGNSLDFTFAAWVKWDGGGNWQRIFDFGDGDTTPGRQVGRYLFLTPRSGAGTLRFALRVDGNEQQLNGPALTPGEWTHLAVTIGRFNTARLFVNGEMVASGTNFGRPATVAPKFSYLGKSQFRPDPLFAGQMADVRILGSELSTAEIAELATVPQGGLTFQQWRAAISFPPGQDGPNDDPEGDGIPNALEFLLGGDPLVPRSATLPAATVIAGNELGPEADPAKSYLSLQVRVRTERSGITLDPQAADTLEGLSAPAASENVRQAGPPVEDGDFEILTFYFIEPIEDLTGGKGFIRLNVTVDGS